MSGLYISYTETLEVSTSHEDCVYVRMTWECVMILTQDHLGKFKVTEWKNAVSGLYLSNGETSKVSISQKDC